MTTDTRNAIITKALRNGCPAGVRVLEEALDSMTAEILHIFDNMSALDLPLMILAVRSAEKALLNPSVAKNTNAALTVHWLGLLLRQEISETQVVIPRALFDRAGDDGSEA